MTEDGAGPVYRKIAADLRGQITGGTLPPGAPLPAERVLAGRYGVQRETIRKALGELEHEGLIDRARPPAPRTVANRTRLTVHVSRTSDLTHPGEGKTAGADAWVRDMLDAGRDPTQDIEVLKVTATADIARRLGVHAGAALITRRLVRYDSGRAHNLITFWFPAAVAAGTILAAPESITEGSVAWLDKTMGPLAHEVEVTAAMPTPAQTTQLVIPAGVPVLIVWRASCSPQQTVLASMAVYPADRAVLKLSL